MNIIIVDDDPKLRGFVIQGFEEHGIACMGAASAEQAEEYFTTHEGAVDLVLLDVMMPGRSGWDFLELLRARGDDTPVIFLTARHAVDERVRGLLLGADDYVIKPFELSELIARVEAVIRRRQPAVRVGDLRLDPARRTANLCGRSIDISPREFDFVLALAESPGKTLSRKDLLHKVWSIDFNPRTNVVDVLVARLRRKLSSNGPPLIETVVGEGYRLRSPNE